MKLRVVVLGAGFGGLELSTLLSEALNEELDLTLIDKSDSFVFGFSKLDVLFGRTVPEAVRVPYGSVAKPGVRFVREEITEIDPRAKRVKTTKGTYIADVLVVALGADYDLNATPGLTDGDNEFYTVEGATRMRGKLPEFSRGHAIVGVCAAPFKCPPAPSECSLLLHDHLTSRGVRRDCDITVIMPFGVPIPPSPDTSKALLKAFAERGIAFVPNRTVVALDTHHRKVVLNDSSELPCDLFLGVPKHRVPDVVARSGMAESGWIAVDRNNLKTEFPGVYAIGDVANVGGMPKAGVFAESAAKVAAASILAEYQKSKEPDAYKGTGTCYIEFGGERVGKVNVDFFSGPVPSGSHTTATVELAKEKKLFGSSRRERWFGIS